MRQKTTLSRDACQHARMTVDRSQFPYPLKDKQSQVQVHLDMIRRAVGYVSEKGYPPRGTG